MIEQLIEAVKKVPRFPDGKMIMPSVSVAARVGFDGGVTTEFTVWNGYHCYDAPTLDEAMAKSETFDPSQDKRERLSALRSEVEKLEKEIAQ